MAKPSIRALLDAKIAKRTDAGMWILPSAIHAVPGFNWRDETTPRYLQKLEDLHAHMQAGGRVPPLEVSLSSDGCGVDIVEGHRRNKVYQRLIAEGHQVEWIRIEFFEGNEVDKAARVGTSQENMKLEPMEIAHGYSVLKAFGLSPDQIAVKMTKTRQHVDQMLILATAPLAIQNMVKSESIAYGLAVETIRQLGPDAAVQKLGAAQVHAAASGKGKVTKKDTKPWTPPIKVITPVLESAHQLIKALPKEFRAWLAGDAVLPPGETVTVDAGWMRQLLVDTAAIEQAEKDAKAKAREKAAKAAQVAIPGTDGA